MPMAKTSSGMKKFHGKKEPANVSAVR